MRLKSPISKSLDFNIHVSSLYANYTGYVYSSEALRNPKYLIKGKINEDGKYILEYQQGDICDIIKNHLKDSITCGPFEIELRVWDRESKELKDIADLFNLNLEDFRNVLDQSCGISIYRDSF